VHRGLRIGARDKRLRPFMQDGELRGNMNNGTVKLLKFCEWLVQYEVKQYTS
jgi:hypothetical protein